MGGGGWEPRRGDVISRSRSLRGSGRGGGGGGAGEGAGETPVFSAQGSALLPTPRPATSHCSQQRLSPGTPPKTLPFLCYPVPLLDLAHVELQAPPKFPISLPITSSLTPVMPSPLTWSLSTFISPLPNDPISDPSDPFLLCFYLSITSHLLQSPFSSSFSTPTLIPSKFFPAGTTPILADLDQGSCHSAAPPPPVPLAQLRP